MQIERLHLLDLDIALNGDSIEVACDELTTGLLVQYSVLIPAAPAGWPVVRFTGPRSQLEELMNRYGGAGVFDPSPANPDFDTHIDPEMQRTLSGS